MKEAKWVRLTAVAGLIFFVLILVQGFALQGNSPTATDSAQKIFNYFKDHPGNLKASAALAGFAMSAVLVWAAGLFGALRRAEGGTSGLAVAAFGGVVLAAASTVAASTIQATVALRIKDLGPSGARFFYTLWQFTSASILLGLLVTIGVTALVCLSTGLFARWFAVVSAVLAVLSIVGAVGIAYVNGAIQAFGFALVFDSLWILAVSVYLWRKPELALA
jgi:hypothetical protein